MLLLVSIALASASAYSAPSFDAYLDKFGLVIDANEYDHRLRVFSANTERILSHNKLYPNSTSFTMKMNSFGHMTAAEWEENFSHPHSIRTSHRSATFRASNASDVPASVDWVSKGAVTAIGNEAACGGACWAFAAAGAIEGALFIKTGTLEKVSAQQLVNCVYPKVDSCDLGGEMQDAFAWIKKNGGICSDSAYSYNGSASKQGRCAQSGTQCANVNSTKLVNVVTVAPTEAALTEAVARTPVSVAIEGLKVIASALLYDNLQHHTPPHFHSDSDNLRLGLHLASS
jgi:cathepsin L/cathepsin P/cathepsin R